MWDNLNDGLISYGLYKEGLFKKFAQKYWISDKQFIATFK